jgi:DUF917 family protein
MKEDMIEELILGATFFGTGGGGSPSQARKIIQNLVEQKCFPQIKTLAEFQRDTLFATAFGVGGIQVSNAAQVPIQAVYELFAKELGRAPDALIPVEIGPVSLAMTFELASKLHLPVLDADIVGGRSTPEVYLETITLFDLPRTPLVVANKAGDKALLLSASSHLSEESFLRNFAEMSGGDAAVLGYPFTFDEVKKAVSQGTVSRACQAGKFLRTKDRQGLDNAFHIAALFTGKIVEIERKKEVAFLESWVTIKNEDQIAKIFIKNENLVLLVDGEPIVTCPDLIILLDKEGFPIFNNNLQISMEVEIIGVPALEVWRSKAAKNLFTPKIYDFNFGPCSVFDRRKNM